jgi:hypothetical protein
MKRLLALVSMIVIIVMFVIGCAPQTQTVIQVVVTATPASPSVEKNPCNNQEILRVMDPLYADGGLIGKMGDESQRASEYLDSGNTDLAVDHIVNAYDYANQIVDYVNGADYPECMNDVMYDTKQAADYYIKFVDEMANGDMDIALGYLTKSTEYLTKTADDINALPINPGELNG